MPTVKWHRNEEQDMTHLHIYENGEIAYFYRMEPARNLPNVYLVNKHVRYWYIDPNGGREVWMPEFLAGEPVTCDFIGNLSNALRFMKKLYDQLKGNNGQTLQTTSK